MNWQPIARIVLRYASGAAVSAGLLAPESATILSADPDVVAAVAGVIGLAVEFAYAQARRKGRPT